MTEIDLAILDEIAVSYGYVERDADEFTAKEIAKRFNIPKNNLFTDLDGSGIKYTRRKAIANGRRQFVYKLIKE